MRSRLYLHAGGETYRLVLEAPVVQAGEAREIPTGPDHMVVATGYIEPDPLLPTFRADRVRSL